MRARPPATIASAIERPERRAPIGRGDMAEHRHRHRRWLGSATICAPSSSTIAGSTVRRPTSCLRSGFSMSGRASERLPTKSGLALPTCPAEAEIVRRHRAVGLLADDDVALLGAQHMHRLGAVGRDAERLARGIDRLPDRAAVIGRHVDLEAELAGEADAEEPRRHAADLALADAHMRHGFAARCRCPRPAARSRRAPAGPARR